MKRYAIKALLFLSLIMFGVYIIIPYYLFDINSRRYTVGVEVLRLSQARDIAIDEAGKALISHKIKEKEFLIFTNIILNSFTDHMVYNGPPKPTPLWYGENIDFYKDDQVESIFHTIWFWL